MSEKDFIITLSISDDYYKAYMNIDFETDALIKSEEIVAKLKEKNIVFGIKYNLIEEICKKHEAAYNILVAEGIPHENGTDAKIVNLSSENKKSKPKLMMDGRVDFKQIGFVEVVNEGQILAKKTLATKGKTGTTVTGKIIKGRDGKDSVFKFGKNVKVSQDGLQLIAVCDGSLEENGDKISVLKILELKGDVGVETGNIFFRGKVVVNGNITSGYSIECDEDLTVNGVVEGAILHVGGDITIMRGIQGMDTADITAGGNLVANFINSASVYIKGNIEAGAIMNSTVKCDGKITVKGKKGSIVGGEITSKKDIEANVIGSELGIITAIKLGTDVEVLDELKLLSTEVKELIEMHTKLDKSLKLLKTKIEHNPSDDRSKAMYKKYSTSFLEIDTNLTEKRQKLKMLNELINNIRGSSLKAQTIYPGTRIMIGSSNFYVKNIIHHSQILKDKGDVVSKPM